MTGRCRRWREFRAEREIGSGALIFAAVADGTAGWGIQRGAGLQVEPATPVRLGGEHVVTIALGPLRLPARVRVCGVIEDDGATTGVARSGFAYETRDGHPEEGVEWFVVEHDLATDVVTFVVTARARAASWYARLGGPISRRLQDAVTQRYLRAAAGIATGTGAASASRA